MTRPVTDYVARVWCQMLPECPGEFYVPAWASARCPVCGGVLHPESNHRNGGPQLFDPETHEPWSPFDAEPEVAG